MRKILLVLLVVALAAAVCPAQAGERRGLSVLVKDPAGKPAEVKVYDQVMALVIGIDSYRHLPPARHLKYCVSDAKAVGQVLQSDFEVARMDSLYNEAATREGILARFNELNRSLGENDGLFVFVASHGTTVRDVGFIVPYDGSFEESETFKNISMVELKDVVGKQLKAKHVFFVIDACYSGTILEKRGTAEKAEWSLEYVKEVTKEPVRYALTAGDAGQQVLDGGPGGHSVFAGRFIEALQEAQSFLTAKEVSEKIARKVFSDAKDRGHVQTPQHGSLTGLGNFVFLKKGAKSLAGVEAQLAAITEEVAALQSRVAGARSQEEKIRLELELQKRQAEEQAKRLEQEALAAAEARLEEQRTREREMQEELARNQARAQAELEKVRQANEEKRRLLEELGRLGGSYAATAKLIEETEAAIEGITKSIEASQGQTLARLKSYYTQKYAEVDRLTRDPWEKKAEFDERKRSALEAYRRNEYDETAGANRRYDEELAAQTGDLTSRVEQYRSSLFVLSAADVSVTLGEFDPETEQFSLAVKSLVPEVPFSRNLALSIASKDARERREKYQRIRSTYEAGGYVGELTLGFSARADATQVPAAARRALAPLAYRFRLLNLTDDNRESFLWINPEVKGRLGKLIVTTEPAGAEVFVNGESRGKSAAFPGVLTLEDLLPGKYRITARAPGYEDAAAKAQVALSATTAMALALKPLPVAVSIETDPPGAEVFIDGARKGYSPLRLVLPPGRYTVECRKSSYIGKSRLEVIAATPISSRFFLSKDGFVWVEAGTFQMGSTDGGIDEKPVNPVTIRRPFYISPYEVTQKQWREVMGTNPSRFKGEYLPLERVSWYEAVEYCNRLSRKERLTPCYSRSGDNITCDFTANGYRLPTEAEWEYAARGGNQSKGYTYAGSNSPVDVAWYESNSWSSTHPVGQKKPNELGLYDMSGNVWEWCWDWYGSYSTSSHVDIRGPEVGSYRVIRGGGWFLSVGLLQVASRSANAPSGRYEHLGFRPVRTAE
jgi:formylglycine-generating enzyme required for sulfatase activity